MKQKKIPYGQSNFADLIESGYAYVDKTRYIEHLENENNRYQFLIRPRRFGKSLFLTMLENYYDLDKKDKFKSLFNNLYIGKNPTPEQGTYAILHFDFSGLNTESHEEFKRAFSFRIQETVRYFLKKYKDKIHSADFLLNPLLAVNPEIGALDIAFNAITLSSTKIFIIIDEYDHFANNLIAMGKTYIDEVKAGGIVRSFFELLKTGTKSTVKRIFITGTSPMMINDLTSGFNIATDYSLLLKYNEMFGFSSSEVEWLINETGIDKNKIKVDIESYYNGYMFNNDSNKKLYNSQMILYLFNQIQITGKQPRQIIDANLQTDYERLRRLAENENNKENILRIVKEGGIYSEIIENFSLDNLNSSEYFVSLLFYLGMLTYGRIQKGRNWLKIPNYSMKTLYWEYIVAYIQNLDNRTLNTEELSEAISNMAYDGDYITYLNFFTDNILKRLSYRDLINFDEKYIKVMLLSTLFISRIYLPVSEDENINGYTDIYLQKHPAIDDIKYEYILEIKYLKANVNNNDIEEAFSNAKKQIDRYREDIRYKNRNDIKFIAIIFSGKDKYYSREIEQTL